MESRKKYLLHFELSEISEAEGFNENDKSFVDLLKGPDALIWLGTGNKFKDVYTGKPDDDFFKEWAFVTELPEYTDQENKWVLYEKKYRADSRQKTLRPSQRHKKAVCEIAADLWKKDPSITIAKMIERQEIIDVSEKENGDCYLEKTLRDWIKDLCPNRKPGRRPK